MKIAGMLLGTERAKLKGVTDLLIRLAKDSDEEVRQQQRVPFFFPVSLKIGDESPYRFSAFTRDISDSGLGLLHPMEFKPGELTVIFRLHASKTIHLAVDITWCQACGEGWYISGGRFLRANDAG